MITVFAAGLLAAGMVFADNAALDSDRLAFAEKLQAKGDNARALAEYEALLKTSGVARDRLLYRLGGCQDALGRKADAVTTFNKLLAEFPKSEFAGRAALYRARLLPVDQSIPELRRLSAPGTADDIRAAAGYELGEALVAKDRAGAIAAFDSVTVNFPKDAHAEYARLRLAVILSEGDDFAERRRAMSLALECSSSKNDRIAETGLLVAGGLCVREGRYDNAVTLFNRQLKRFPDGKNAAEARLGIVRSYIAKGRCGDALPLLSDRTEEERYLKAFALQSLSRHDDAIAAYDELLAKHPEGSFADRAWMDRLRVLYAKGDHRAVLKSLSDRPVLPAGQEGAACWIGGCSAQAVTNIPMAVEYMRRCSANEKGVNAPEAAYTLAWLQYRSGAMKEAASVWRSMSARWPKHADAAKALLAAGNAEVAGGDSAAAIRDWSRLLEEYPTVKEAGEALYLRAREELRGKNYRVAASSLDEFLHRFPDNRRRAEALYFRGFCCTSLKEPKDAEKYYRDALAANPPPEFEREALLALGTILRQDGREKEAAKLFSKLIDTSAVDRLEPARLAWVADVLFSVGDNATAEKAARTLAARNADAGWNQVAHSILGLVHLAKGETDAAKRELGIAVKEPANTVYGAQASLELGRIETKLGNFSAARDLLADAVRRSGSDEMLSLRAKAYAALAANEEARGNGKSALEYHMMIGTLFDDPETTPHALRRAAEILEAEGKKDEAAGLRKELKERYPDSKEAK